MKRQLLYSLLICVMLIVLSFVACVASTQAACSGYTVKRGDTLYRIAIQNNTTVQAIQSANNLTNSLIYAGQCLLMPNQPQVSGLKGLAMADASHPVDLQTLGVTWQYTWGWNTNPGFVPMVRAMQSPPECQPIILVGNEPNAKEPNGYPLTPEQAVINVKAIQTQCPQSKLVVGNVSADDWSSVGGWGSGYNWLRSFLQAYPAYNGALGVHCYTNGGANYCINLLSQMRNLYKGEMWLTEGNCLNCSTSEFIKLLSYASKTFTRYAFYTNRQPTSAYTQGWALQGADMIGQDGMLTPNGAIYAGWH